MSLLLDALKKAAEAKNRQSAELDAEPAELVELAPEEPPRPEPVPPAVSIDDEPLLPNEARPTPLIARASDPLGTPPSPPQPTVEPPATRARDTASPRPRPESQRPSSPESLYDEFDETQQLNTDELRTELLGASQYSSPDHARNLFSSKAVRKPIRQRPSILLMLLVIVVVVGAAGWLYYGYGERQFALQRELARIRSSAPIQAEQQAGNQQIARLSNTQNTTASRPVSSEPSAPQPRQPAPVPATQAPSDAPRATESSASEQSATAETAVPAAAPSPSAPAPRQPTSQATTPSNDTRVVEAPRQPAAPASNRAPAPKPTPVQRASEADTSNGQLSFTRSQREAPLDVLVRRGYEAYQQGRLSEAGAAYREALGTDANHRDALLGAAAVALRSGDGAGAARYYQRLLNLNPRDPAALVGLQSLSQNANPVQLESELRTLLEQVPESAPLHFALGSVYSRDQRWAAAQQAYFNAHRLDAGNPDYLYNLAVSLDNLGKRGAAAGFYRQALEAARQRAASFNQSAALARLGALQGEPR